MNFLICWIFIYGIIGVTFVIGFDSECGVKTFQREPRRRSSRIISGSLTKEGNFPWQVSLELLHPSLGFLGHWCGAVLVDSNWILSAAHCVHNDLFNLPIPAIWTAVLGEYNREIESGNEQRISIEKIIMHSRYHNFFNDLVLMKLSRSANISTNSNVRKICLPLENNQNENDFENDNSLDDIPELIRDDNYLRQLKNTGNLNLREVVTNRILNLVNSTSSRQGRKIGDSRRRNDKFYKERAKSPYDFLINRQSDEGMTPEFTDCFATGWGKFKQDGDLTKILLKTKVPIHRNSRCEHAYGNFVKIHKGHLCAGRLDGKGGTCVGDSGGPLQCRSRKSGPWVLAGITSFGSGCALKGFPDVYTKISHYIKWINETIEMDRLMEKSLQEDEYAEY